MRGNGPLWRIGLFILCLCHIGFASSQLHFRPTRKKGKTSPWILKCFPGDGNDLRAAVRIYLDGGDELQSVKDQYGESLKNWCVDQVYDFSDLFRDRETFNEDISTWNTSSATMMDGMFWNTKEFQVDIGQWDVSHVMSMKRMFQDSNFNQPISSWDVSNVEDFSATFLRSSFNQDISNWDVRKAKRFDGMFQGSKAFDQDLCSWGPKINKDELVSLHDMFQGSACPATTSPRTDDNHNHMGPFCTPCNANASVSSAIGSQLEGDSTFMEAEKLSEDAAVTRPVLNTNQLDGANEVGKTLKPSVHTHESMSRGVQLVLLMLVMFSLNGLLMSVVCSGRRQSAQVGPYSRLALSNPSDEPETELSHVGNSCRSGIEDTV